VRERFLGFVPFGSEVADRFPEGGAAISSSHSADVLKDGSHKPELIRLVL
jgi:hypothetical protein